MHSSSSYSASGLESLSTIFCYPGSFVLYLIPLWIVWYIWTFTIRPRWYPHEAKIYPYWVPGVGHLVSFFLDADALTTRAREYFSNTRHPFGLILGGQTMYMVTSGKDFSAIVNNIKSFDFDHYLRDVQVKFGASPSAVSAMWNRPISKEAALREGAFPNPHGKALTNLCEGIFKAQLHPGKELEALSNDLLGIVHEEMKWRRMPKAIILSEHEDGSRTVSLRGWIQHALFISATNAFFGPKLLEIAPDLLDTFLDFEEDSWQITMGIPAVFARRTHAAKALAQKALERYFSLPLDQRPGASFMVRTLEAEMRAVGITTRDVSKLLFTIYWVVNGQAWKLTFWLIAYILSSPSAHTSIRTELNPHITALHTSSISPNEFYTRIESLPHLLAAYHETTRLTTASMTIRSILSDTIVSGVELKRGAQVMVPSRQLLMDSSVFGPDTETFRPERFFDNPGLAKDPAYRPFGGGLTYCPGRFMAMREVLTVCALVIGGFDVEKVDEKFPIRDKGKPMFGVISPGRNEDMRVRVRVRGRG